MRINKVLLVLRTFMLWYFLDAVDQRNLSLPIFKRLVKNVAVLKQLIYSIGVYTGIFYSLDFVRTV